MECCGSRSQARQAVTAWSLLGAFDWNSLLTLEAGHYEPGVFDVRLSPDGTRIAFVRGRDLCVATLDGDERVLASESSDTVSWGSADFIAAEEMGRMRGWWWSPDSQRRSIRRM